MSYFKRSAAFLLALLFLLHTSLAWPEPDQIYNHQQQKRTTKLEERVPKQCDSKSCYKFYSNATAPYLIEEWPLIPKWIETREFYSGLIPIDESDPSRNLFFIFKPAINASINPREVTIWLNGGPGCSSLVGFFEENGPFLWRAGQYQPERNPFSWAQITNMLWVEQPVGTGYTEGTRTAHNEGGVARDFVGFYKNWEKLFGISNYKTYVTGESYAGRYVPYIAAEMLNQNDTTYFDVGSALVYDVVIGSYRELGGTIPFYDFVKANNVILNLNQIFLDRLEKINDRCGWRGWMDTYLKFPPPGNQPKIPSSAPNASCDTQGLAQSAIIPVNPCFNIYHITDTCPTPDDRLTPFGPGGVQPYFNRTDVRKALHAPLAKSLFDWWFECAISRVFRGPVPGFGPEQQNDQSPDPIQGVLPQVIEATNRVLIRNGDYDALILTNGTLLSLQNMTWNGQLGFQEAPSQDFIVPIGLPNFGFPGSPPLGPQGIMGKQHYERGLMWVESYQTGHQQPQWQPRATLRHLMWLLGRIDEL